MTDDCLEECLRNIVKRFQISASEAVELLRRRIRYDLRVKDPYARVGQMFRTLAEVTRLYGLEDVWKIKRNQRMRAEILINAVEPAPLRETLKMNIVSKEVLQNPKELMTIVREKAVQYEFFRPQLSGSNAGSRRREGRSSRRNPDRTAGRNTEQTSGASSRPQPERKGSTNAGVSRKPSKGRQSRHSSSFKKGNCWFCGSDDHQLADCPDCDEQRKAAVRKAMTAAQGDPKRQRSGYRGSIQHGAAKASQPQRNSDEKKLKDEKADSLRKKKDTRNAGRRQAVKKPKGQWTAVINGQKTPSTRVHLDSGADVSILSTNTVNKINKSKKETIQLKTVTNPLEVQWINGSSVMTLKTYARVDLTLSMPTGDLVWKDHHVYIQDLGKDEIWISRPAMEQQGIDVYRVAETVARGSIDRRVERKNKIYRKKIVGVASEIDSVEPHEEVENILSTQDISIVAGVDREELAKAKQEMLGRAAKQNIATAVELVELERLVDQYDIWRVNLGTDPAVEIEPMRAHLRSDAVPIAHPPRRLSPEKREFLKKMTSQLEENGLIRRVLQSEWGHPVVVVPKPGNRGHRMTVDLRGLNKQTVPISQALTDLESSSTLVLRDAKVYGQLDAFKGFWQLPLANDAQLCHSFVTPWGVYVPTRVLQGNTNSAGFFQSAMQELFSSLLDRGLQIYIDDLLAYAGDIKELWRIYAQVFKTCAERGLKLSPEKC
ncbi:MAG: reverse transcriptase family protein, partial [Bacteroidota bacterium]